MFVFLLIPLLAASGVSAQFALSFGTTAPPVPKSFDPNCKDKMDTCWKMPESNCRAPYEDWAKEYCANRCGYCIGPTTPAPPCVNKLPNCESYDKSVCTNPDYATWAGDNCRYFCRKCSNAELARLDSITTTISPQDCVDKVDCRQYGANACSDGFKAWSKDNCPNHCGYCTGIPTPPPVCEDKIPNCKAYNPDTCTDPDYKLWVQDNCKKFCGLCKNSPTIGYFPPSPPSPGKRAQGAERPKRQFHASHHHQGGSHDCWDGSSTDPYCNTAAPNAQESTPVSSLEGSTGFPGSEFHPRPKPNPDWDSKPSTPAATSAATTNVVPPILTGHATPTMAPSTGSPTTTTAPPTVTEEATTTTVPPTITQEPTTTTAPPTKSQESTTTTALPTESTENPATTQTSGTMQPDTPSTTVLAVKTPGQRSTSAPGETTTTAGQANITSGTQTTRPQTPAIASTSGSGLTSTTAPTASTASPFNTTPQPTQTTPVASTTPGTTAVPCEDTVDNCAMYGKQACENPVYRPWAKAHCSLFCGFCVPVTLTPFECKNKLPNCKEFDSGDLCTADSFFAWARENCFAYCGFPPCGNNTGIKATTAPPKTSPAIVPKTSHSNCSDKLDNCLQYPDAKCVGIYEPWAKSHCAYRCGYCQDFFPCEDVNPDCDKFPPNSCAEESFKGWARQNCRKFCNLCARPTENPALTQPTGTKGSSSMTDPTPEVPVTSVDPVMMTSKQPVA
ncbi:uncharacterized protein LOC123547587 isoform X2 [Mercenaria mercenaria]|uniref:uncharacterized protein LOC123547587 isoform X2 n=1 Tax=Mercenaria mercenaria TaxID=6596 RepID=UPI00234E935D|nr:uncharacterized protein LOC123547587 isoform X2 [Mercenaria mercenaria]